jgi:hypothetical protein
MLCPQRRLFFHPLFAPYLPTKNQNKKQKQKTKNKKQKTKNKKQKTKNEIKFCKKEGRKNNTRDNAKVSMIEIQYPLETFQIFQSLSRRPASNHRNPFYQSIYLVFLVYLFCF